MGGGDEPAEERVRCVGFGEELRVILGSDEEGVVGNLNHLNESIVRCCPREHEASLRIEFTIVIVEFESVPVTFVDQVGLIKGLGLGSREESAILRTEAHGTALLGDAFLALLKIDHRVRSVGIELCGMGA